MLTSAVLHYSESRQIPTLRIVKLRYDGDL